MLCWTFFRFSRTFPPLIFSPRQPVSRHLAGKAHCNAGTATHWHARKTAPRCCKHRQLASPTKLKPICTKFQIFHFTLTSLDFTLSLPDFTLRCLSLCNPDNLKNKKLTKKTIGLKTSDVNIKIFRLTLWIPQYLYSQITT